MAKDKQNKGGKSKGFSTWKFTLIILVVSLAIIPYIRHGYVFLLAAMLPSAVALLVDRTWKKSQFKAVAAANFAGTFPTLVDLWQQDNTIDAMLNIVADPFVWLYSYGAAAAGWILVWAAPLFTLYFMELTTQFRLIRLKEDQRKLIDEWGPEIKHWGEEISEEDEAEMAE